MAAQMPQEEKKKFADYLIDTSDEFESARQQTLRPCFSNLSKAS